MKQETQDPYSRYQWLSWLWGWLLSVVSFMVYTLWKDITYSPGTPWQLSGEELLVGLTYTFMGTLIILSLPAFLGSALRTWAIKRLFASYLAQPVRPSWLWLLGQVAFIFEASVLVLLLVFQILFYQFGSEFDVVAKIFFGLSLPWLLSSVGAAWWVMRENNTATMLSAAKAL